MEDIDPTNSTATSDGSDATDDSHIQDLHDHSGGVDDHHSADGVVHEDASVDTDDREHPAPAEQTEQTDEDQTLHDPHEAADSIWGDVEHSAPTSEHDTVSDVPPVVDGSDGVDALNHDFKIAPFPGFEEFNGIHGTPVEDMRLWEQQSEPMDCAVATTDMLFRSLGFDVGEVPLEHLFQQAGIYDPALGTDIHLIADVLNQLTAQSGVNLQAVEISHYTEQNLEDLLDAGVRPLIGLNASEIYDPMNRMLNALGIIPNAGHAVQLTGIIHNEQGTFAVINDPGVPNGSGTVLPMDLFMDAASKMDYDAVVLIPT